MTYFGFLGLFLGIPILLLLGAAWWDRRNGRLLPARFSNAGPWIILGIHVLTAVLYTTPWDNYLVATRVWWYDPELVTGITLGWVPIEEYTFFVVQPILTGLWLLFWMRRTGKEEQSPAWENFSLRQRSTLVAGVIWITSVILFWSGWLPGNYLALELIWAVPPIGLQLVFGADILWRQRRLVAVGLIPTTLYLAFADALAIQSGTWTINPEKSLQWYLGGVLPVEEFIFFLITNVLIVFGMTLALAEESGERLRRMQAGSTWLRRRQMMETGRRQS